MDIAIKFWKNWLNEKDSLKRPKRLEKMAIVRDLTEYNHSKCKKIAKKDWMRMVTQNLDFIFQDLVDTIAYLEQKKKGSK